MLICFILDPLFDVGSFSEGVSVVRCIKKKKKREEKTTCIFRHRIYKVGEIIIILQTATIKPAI